MLSRMLLPSVSSIRDWGGVDMAKGAGLGRTAWVKNPRAGQRGMLSLLTGGRVRIHRNMPRQGWLNWWVVTGLIVLVTGLSGAYFVWAMVNLTTWLTPLTGGGATPCQLQGTCIGK